MPEEPGLDSLISGFNSAIQGAVSVGDTLNQAVGDAKNWGSLIDGGSTPPPMAPNASGVQPSKPSAFKSLLSGGAGTLIGLAALAILAILALRR